MRKDGQNTWIVTIVRHKIRGRMGMVVCNAQQRRATMQCVVQKEKPKLQQKSRGTQRWKVSRPKEKILTNDKIEPRHGSSRATRLVGIAYGVQKEGGDV